MGLPNLKIGVIEVVHVKSSILQRCILGQACSHVLSIVVFSYRSGVGERNEKDRKSGEWGGAGQLTLLPPFSYPYACDLATKALPPLSHIGGHLAAFYLPKIAVAKLIHLISDIKHYHFEPLATCPISSSNTQIYPELYILVALIDTLQLLCVW